MTAKPIVLKALLQQRHLQTHSAFRREYDRVAADVDPTLKGGWPSKAQFYRWISGELIGLPYADHCRILEGMFPGWKVDQLFQLHDGGIEFIPEPPTPQTPTPTIRPIPPIMPADVIGNAQPTPTSEHEPGSGLLVEYDDAELSYDGRTYRATMCRKLLNSGEEPISRYLIRISVDRYPGSPEQSNELYRNDPLTWDELHLQAWHDGEPMTWQVRHDRDAFKELWLLFENDQARFPLYPGESTEIVYSYTVSDIKWGQWFQRAVRLPTRRLIVRLDFPAELGTSVWGMETSMSAQALPFRTPITRTEDGDRTRFAWTTDDPPLHTRYRIEWRFRQPTAPRADRSDTKPSATMAKLGVVQLDDPLLRQPARPFTLPEEAEDARRVVAELHSALERVAQAHVFGKGLGIAAPQIGIGRAAAVVRTPSGEIITLLNPQIIDQSDDQDEQYEGCLSFFDVRGKVLRPLRIQVEHQHVDGTIHITVFERGVARLVAHEIDHLAGVLYTDHMADSANVIPVEQYRGGGQSWQYA